MPTSIKRDAIVGAGKRAFGVKDAAVRIDLKDVRHSVVVDTHVDARIASRVHFNKQIRRVLFEQTIEFGIGYSRGAEAFICDPLEVLGLEGFALWEDVFYRWVGDRTIGVSWILRHKHGAFIPFNIFLDQCGAVAANEFLGLNHQAALRHNLRPLADIDAGVTVVVFDEERESKFLGRLSNVRLGADDDAAWRFNAKSFTSRLDLASGRFKALARSTCKGHTGAFEHANYFDSRDIVLLGSAIAEVKKYVDRPAIHAFTKQRPDFVGSFYFLAEHDRMPVCFGHVRPGVARPVVAWQLGIIEILIGQEADKHVVTLPNIDPIGLYSVLMGWNPQRIFLRTDCAVWRID